MNPLRNIIRSAIKKETDTPNIMMCGFDGYFETMFNDIGFNTYVTPTLSRYAWHVGLPTKGKNTFILPQTNDIPVDLELDAVLCCDRLFQYDLTSQLANMLHIPHICVEHFISSNRITKEDIEKLKLGQKFDAHVSVSKEIQADWEESTYIPYGIQRITKEKKEPIALLVGDFQQNDYQIIQQLSQNIPNLYIVGENHGISRKAKDETELESLYDRASVYINIATEGRIPTSLLKAMGANCAIVSNISPVLSGFLNSENSISCSSLPQFIDSINKIIASSSMRDKFGDAAQSTVIEKFDMQDFKTKWTDLINNVGKRTYIR